MNALTENYGSHVFGDAAMQQRLPQSIYEALRAAREYGSRLTREEAMAINWHMGGFDDRVRGGSYTVGVAFQEYPLAVLTHTADFLATYLDEKRATEEE